MKRSAISQWALLLLAMSACSDPLDPAYLLNKPRVIGATATVVGDVDGRTSPLLGETVRFDWLLAYPQARQESTFVFFACEPAASSFGVSFCSSDDMLAQGLGLTPTLEAPSIEVPIPDDYAGAQILLLGGICMGGVVDTTIDMNNPDEAVEVCADGVGQGQLVVLLHTVDRDGEFNNHAPGIAELRLGGEVWTAPVPDDVTAGCAGLDLPTFVVDGDDVPVTIVMTEGSREMFTAIEGAPPEEVVKSEELQNSVLITAGELERTFTFIDGDETMTELDYSPVQSDADIEVDVPSEGLVVKLIVVMRDRRGGVDIAERALCMMP